MPQLEQPKKKLPPWSQAKVNVPDVSTMTLNGTPSQTVPVHNVPETGPTNPPISTSGSAHISVSSPDVISNSRIDNASTASGPNPTVTYSNASGTESPTPHLNNKTEASHTQTPSTVPTSMSVEAQAFVSNSTAPPTAEPRGLNRYTTNTQHNTRGDAREAQAEVKNDSTTPLKPPKGKRKACRYYKATGQCKAGDACAFQHNTTQQNSTRAGSERTSSGHGTAGIDSEGTNNRGGDSRGTGETSRSQRNAKRDAKRDAVNNHTQMEKDVEVADGPDIDSGNKPVNFLHMPKRIQCSV
ncbi:hypothetical protein SARC_01464 [Sphaeroforma arctica JP610]|uniref:C3H1-type domain-containing protein n=1 Tax=Sphaeroforma arctica JP610 TaxID=667725 RepID=A0A0L0GBG9_9EUKA|nr:hypothetical protein SARC_01464 [Sphaeroforma arctica JP610]KNC86367.1 hypothetical protein SARC_01464 [Sphaeroforma arctica JP610]|eukprot:XP_014160269.1 hypothetical protein SARC_01464 [Sphaeroforma arctica JP610]